VPKVQYKVIKTADDAKDMSDSFFLQRSAIVISEVSGTPAASPEAAPRPPGKAPAAPEAAPAAETPVAEVETSTAAAKVPAAAPKTPAATAKTPSGARAGTKPPRQTLAENQSMDVGVVSIPREYRDVKLGIEPANTWWSKTTVSIKKIDNTELVSSVGVEVTNTTVQNIGDIGGAIVKIVGLAAAIGLKKEEVKVCSLPRTYELFADGLEHPIEDECISVQLGPLPPDVIEVSKIPQGVGTHSYYYSACRDAVVTFNIDNATANRTQTVRVADPRYVQAVRFPPKGSITSHSQCGVSVVTEPTTAASASASDVVAALATQGKAIKDAIDASKKPAATK
jgi:hypothetical protein